MTLDSRKLEPVAAITKRILGKRPAPATLWRWRLKGVNGARLEQVKVGPRWFTTEDAFLEFIQRQTQNAMPSEEEQTPERDEAKTRRLEKAGLL